MVSASNKSVKKVKAESPWVPSSYKVTSRQLENDKLLTFEMAPEGDEQIDPISAGQFNMLYIFGVGEIPISVSSVLTTHPKLVHTIQSVGPVSNAINQLKVGDVLGVRGPFGTSWPVEKAKGKDVLIIAGGVGLCPLRPVIEEILTHRADFGKCNILYGTRDPDSIIYHQDIISWQSDPSVSFDISVDHAFSKWRGHVGVVTNLIEKADFDPQNTIAFICGPEIMMRYGAYACIDSGIAEENINVSMERNMKCAFGLCGHCQYGPYFVCKDGPVFSFDRLKRYLKVASL